MIKKNSPVKHPKAGFAKSIKSISQDSYLYQKIFDAILAQSLLPGTRLPEGELSEIFGVSRSVVRRALLRLSQSHIVESQPNRGAFVARPSIKKAREILAARRLVESAIVKEAASCASKEDFAELRSLVEEEKALFTKNERSTGIRLSGDFHLKLSAITKNSTLMELMNILVPQTSLVIALYEKPGYPNCSYVEHFDLVDALSRGDSKVAETMMDKHLQRIEEKINLDDIADKCDLSQVFSKVVI